MIDQKTVKVGTIVYTSIDTIDMSVDELKGCSIDKLVDSHVLMMAECNDLKFVPIGADRDGNGRVEAFDLDIDKTLSDTKIGAILCEIAHYQMLSKDYDSHAKCLSDIVAAASAESDVSSERGDE